VLTGKIEMNQREPHAEMPIILGWKEVLLTDQPDEEQGKELVNKVKASI
jgi:hypothetical protein